MSVRAARVIVIVLTFLIGVAIAGELFFFFRPSQKPGVYLVKPVGHISQHKYKLLGHACGGSYYSYTTGYETPDGVMISESLAPFSSPSRAKRELQRRLKYAVSIIKRGAKYDNKGRKSGERVMALFNSKEEGKKVAILLWTENDDMYEIQSFSLSHILEFERTRFINR
jgi:hypothetical protein